MDDPNTLLLRKAITDEVHLKLLTLGYWISAGIDAFFALFGVFYAVMGFGVGTMFAKMPVKPGQEPPPPFFQWIFVILGACIFSVFIVLALVKAHTARCIKARRSRAFCMVVAGFSCLGIPYGTLLGVCTFLVLVRESIVQLFNGAPPASPGSQPGSGP